MKCNSCQEPLDEGSKFCPHCGGKVLNTPSIVLCPGTPTNPCGAELQESFKFCKECGAVVDPSLFGKKRKVCTNCGNAFTKDGEKFCAQCGSPCQDGRTTSPDEIKKRPSEKVDDNNDSKAVVQIEKTGATSLKSESGHLASSNSPVSSKANDKEKKSKKEKKMKGKKSESPDKDKKEDQEYEEKKKGIEEKGEHTSQIKTSTSWSSEKEDISEATQYPKQVKAKPEAEKLKLDTNTDSSKRFPSFSSRGPSLLFLKTGGISSSINKTGGQGIKKDAVRVHFHAIISSEFGLVDEDKVIVRFGEQKLGGWAYNEYKCTLVRYMEDDYREFELHMNIPKEIFFQSGKKIEYKYVVCKDAVKKNTKYVWENYSTQCVRDTNRIIAMRENQAAVDDWHQYDGVVYPKKQGEGFLNKNWKTVKGFLFEDNPERHKEDLKLSLLCFQPKLFKDFSSGQKFLVPVDEAIMQLDQLEHCMRKVYYTDRKCFSEEIEYERQITVAILVPVLQSFENLPLKDWMESIVDAERRMIKAIAVLSALGCLHLKLEQDEQDLLASGLFVRPNQENRKCYDLESIDRFVTKDKKKLLSKFLKDFIEGKAMTAKDSSIFLCMPLYHFLTVEVQPFEKMPYDTSHDSKDQKWWGVSSLVGAVSRFKTIKSWKVPLEVVLSILHPLFEMDYLLPRTFMAMLKLEEVEAAIRTGMIPIDVSAATLICYLKPNSANYFQKENLVGSALHTLRDLSGKVKVTDESSNTDFIKRQMFCKIAGDLVSETLLSSAKVLLVSAVQIFLLAAANYDTLKRNKDSLESDTPQQFDHSIILSKLYEGVKMWQHKHHYCWKLESFLEDWNSIFAPTNLPSEDVKQAWNSSAMKDLYELLRGEISRNTFKQRDLINIYCRSTDKFHPGVQNCLSQLAFQVIETSYNVSMHQQGEFERQRFGGLLSSFYQREWEAALKKGDMEEDRIILHHILTWTPFSHFLKMFYGDERKIYHLSENCNESLVRAISVIDDRIKALDNGNITIQDLTVIKEAHGKFQELALIISEKSESKKPGKIFDTVKAVEVRQIEFDSYNKQMKYVTTLTQLCQHIVAVDLGAIDNKIKHLTKKKDLHVSEICQPANIEIVILDNFQPKITAFELSDEVTCMLEPMQKLYESNIFIKLWSEIGCQAKFKSQSASLEEVCEKVWKPASAKMEEITWKLVTGEIEFVEMQNYLGNNDYEKMVQEMAIIKVPKGQADERIKQLKQFHQLETCFYGAKAIGGIVEAYGLKGDFGVIKTIISQEHAAKMMMKVFDDSLLDTCAFLKDFTSEQIRCLNVFENCKCLVLWLQEFLKGGLKELKVFVDLARISARDAPMEIARVNCLHAAITGFASLIFDLDENSGYKELVEKCQILWKELKADPNLPKKLQDTQCHLEWLKTVKQAHGSVEVTSLAQAEAINSKGIFLVGALDTAGDASTVLNLHNTVQLVSQREETKKENALQQLQDHQILVAGTEEQDMDIVDRFPTACMEFKTEVAEDVLNIIKITYGQNGIDSLISGLKQFAKVDTCDEKVLVFCDSKHAEDVQKCVISHYSRAEKERNKYLIHREYVNLKVRHEFREVENAVQSMNNWYQEEFTLSFEEQPKTDEVVAMVKNEFPEVFIKQTKDRIAILSENEDNIERAKFKVNMALGRIKITGRRRKYANPQTYDKSFSDMHMSEDDQMDAGLIFPSSNFQSRQQTVDLAAKSYCTKEGLTAKVYFGDLTSLPVDCIVNAANELLSHDGGVALTISKAAGRDFDQEGKEYVKKRGVIPVTQCCVTSSGKLSYKVVIRAVGPRWSDYKYNEKEKCTLDLKTTIVNCLIEANKFKMASIAIPSLCSGIFGVPKPLCAQMYAQAVVEYSMTYGLQSIKEIHFVDIIPDMCQLTQSAFDAEFQCS